MRFLALSLYLFTASVASAAQSCEMSSIGACANTNALVWAKSFKPALLAFLDKRKVAWLGERQAVARVTQEVLGGAPDDVAKVADGVLRFSAVRAQSALERGAIFITDTGTIKAIGVLHFNCATTCEKSYSLSIITPLEDEKSAALVRAWGDEQMTLNKKNGLESDLTTIAHVEVLQNRN